MSDEIQIIVEDLGRFIAHRIREFAIGHSVPMALPQDGEHNKTKTSTQSRGDRGPRKEQPLAWEGFLKRGAIRLGVLGLILREALND